MSNKSEQTNINFEDALKVLNDLVSELEQGNLPLEDALKKFEQGVSLIRHCQETLNKAEQTVQILLKKNGKNSLEPFSENAS